LNTIISQLIVTIQGEGPTVGTPILLIRLGNCNLNCNFCDSKWSNNLKSSSEFNPSNISFPTTITDDNFSEFVNFINSKYLNKYQINTILLTGGEPFLDKEFIGKIVNSIDIKVSAFEIETNGTLLNATTDHKLFKYCWDKIIRINISPKLDPKAYINNDRIKEFRDIVELFISNEAVSLNTILKETPTSIIYKFVHCKEYERNIESFISGYKSANSIYIMPLTPARSKFKTEESFYKKFRENCSETLDFCMKTGYIFSPREHIWLFNQNQRNEYVDLG